MNFKIRTQLLINKFLNNSDLNRKLDALLGKKSHTDPVDNYWGHVSGYVDKGTQILLALKYRELFEQGKTLTFEEVEFRNHSQNGEDGILLYIFSLIGTTNKKGVEICAGNGKECNSANLIINHGWRALLADGDKANTDFAKDYFARHPNTFLIPPPIVNEWITAENVNDIMRRHGFVGEIDFLFIDLDGIDYWLWKAIDAVMPRVVMVEIQATWRCSASVTVPYCPDFVCKWLTDPKYGRVQYGGASLPAFAKLAKEKGYRLIGSNRYGFNVVFMRNDVGIDVFPEIDQVTVFSHEVANLAYDRARPLFEGLEWEEV